MPRVEGSFHALFFYDVADEIRWPELQAVLGSERRTRKPEFKIPAPAYVQLSRPPIAVPGGLVEVSPGELFRATVEYFEHGVVVVGLERTFADEWDGLVAFACRWMNAADLEKQAREVAAAAVARIRVSLVNPYEQWLDEEYFVVHLRSASRGDGRLLSGRDLIEQHGAHIAQIVRGELSALADGEQAEVLRSSLSYLSTDLLVTGWMASVLYDTPDGALPMLQLLEYANVQLIEYRRYDEILSRVLTEAYDSLEHRRGLLSGWRLAREARRMDALRLDITELAERTENAIKFLSDMYYARAFNQASQRVGTLDYRALVEAKLRTSAELYHSMVDEFREKRSFFLEMVVIVILLIEIIPLVRGLL